MPHAKIHQIFVYPIKSCGGIELQSALLTASGIDLDRAWMVVDEQRDFVSQRDLPRMALIQPTLRESEMVLRAPGMLALHVQIDAVESATRARVWDDVVAAFDMGDVAAQWFSDFLNEGIPIDQKRKLRLVRFDPDHVRLASMQWTGGTPAPVQFADGFPYLVTTQAAHVELAASISDGTSDLSALRFRPNLVLAELAAHDEDHIDTLSTQTGGGAVEFRLVKPCVRCAVPDVNPRTAQTGHAVNDALKDYRVSAKMNGGLTFGMNAMLTQGDGVRLSVGDLLEVAYAF